MTNLSKRRGQKLEGLEVKIRSEGKWIVASLHIDGVWKDEITRLNSRYADGPGGERYQAWLKSVEELFAAWMATVTGQTPKVLRQAPKGP